MEIAVVSLAATTALTGIRISWLGFVRLNPGTSNLDVDLSAINYVLMQELNGFVGSLRRREFDKSVSQRSGTAGDDVRIEHTACFFELLFQSLSLGREGQISNKYFGGHICSCVDQVK